jgi:two-component system response regulator YesN
MLTLIRSEYSDVVTLRMLAHRLGKQPDSLGRLFYNELGVTVRDCLTRVRMERAEELVRAGVKIESVALSVGYRSKKNFYRQFRRHFGTTPDEYRHRHVTATSTHSRRSC